MDGMDDRNQDSGVQWLDQGVTLPVGVPWQAASDAPASGVETTADPALELISAGLVPHRIRPEVSGSVYRWALPEPAGLVWLLSRHSSPHEMSGSADKRRLGVPVKRVAIDGWNIPMDDASFREGWHPWEGLFRWTNGRAALTPRRPCSSVEIELSEFIPLRYLIEGDARPDGPLPEAQRRPLTASTIAVVTHADDRAVWLPIWLRHHAGQIGAANCYVIADADFAGEVGGANLLRLPPSAADADRTARFASAFSAALLAHYDHVAFAAPDEILAADPRYYRSLAEFCVACAHDTVRAIGLDVIHVERDEPPFDHASSLLQQRRWLHATSAACAPVLSRRPLSFQPDLTAAAGAIPFDRLFSFRLRFADRDRAMQASAEASRDLVAQQIASRAALPPVGGIDLDADCVDTRRFVQSVLKSSPTAHDASAAPFEAAEEQLWRVPERFRGII